MMPREKKAWLDRHGKGTIQEESHLVKNLVTWENHYGISWSSRGDTFDVAIDNLYDNVKENLFRHANNIKDGW